MSFVCFFSIKIHITYLAFVTLYFRSSYLACPAIVTPCRIWDEKIPTNPRNRERDGGASRLRPQPAGMGWSTLPD